MNELILYCNDDAQTRLHLRAEGDTVWLSQLEIAEIFQTTKQNMLLHAKNIFAHSPSSTTGTSRAMCMTLRQPSWFNWGEFSSPLSK